MFDILDDPDEIDKRCREGPVLCWLLNPNIRFPKLHWLVHNRYVFELGDNSESIKAVALGFYKEPIPDELEPKQRKRWYRKEQDKSEDYDILEELILIKGKPYIVLYEQVTNQQIDELRSIGLVLTKEHNEKMRYLLSCAYYNEQEQMNKKPSIHQKGE